MQHIYRNFKLTEKKKPVKRTVAVNASWKSILTDKGLIIQRLLGEEILKLADLNYPDMVVKVEELIEDGPDALEDLIDDYVDLLDIIEQSKDYMKEETYNNVKDDVSDVLSLLDEGNEWTEKKAT